MLSRDDTNSIAFVTQVILGFSLLFMLFAIIMIAKSRKLDSKFEEDLKIKWKMGVKENFPAYFVPCQLIVELFPMIPYHEAYTLLRKEGLIAPTMWLNFHSIDNKTREGIQSVVEYLEKKYPPSDRAKEKSTAECCVCIMEYPNENFISCKSGRHKYCVNCVKVYAKEMLFGLGTLGFHKESKEVMTELVCLDENCSAGFNHNNMVRVLEEKELERYGELQGIINLAMAEIEDLCSCPKCGIQAILSSTEKTFICPVEACKFKSCRECKSDAHPGKTCSEAQHSKLDRRRQKMEEDMTSTLVRKCTNPRCNMTMIKTGGCNLLTCSCGYKMCNVCKERIYNYSHFCQQFNCNHRHCGKCVLFRSTESSDKAEIRRIEREAEIEMSLTERSGENNEENKCKTESKRGKKGFVRAVTRILGLHRRHG